MSLPDVDSLPEPDNALTEFMVEWEKKLKEKQDEEKKLTEEMKAAAQKELDAWNKERDIRLKKKAENNTEVEKVFVETTESELSLPNPWERITKLIDIALDQNDAKSDTGRMISIFIGMKNEPVKTTTD